MVKFCKKLLNPILQFSTHELKSPSSETHLYDENFMLYNLQIFAWEKHSISNTEHLLTILI